MSQTRTTPWGQSEPFPLGLLVSAILIVCFTFVLAWGMKAPQTAQPRLIDNVVAAAENLGKLLPSLSPRSV